ncbi:MAG: hydrogenase formation protein HypD [Candidatus Alcyoniella australis]|nr:hydrogenase formation protein HypD [Candidatus Alcyoniella australis]
MTDSAMRSRELVQRLTDALADEAALLGHVRIMHVCGTHEHEIRRFALRSLLPSNLEVIAGPGCPVCITPASAIATAISLAQLDQRPMLCTYGDIVRVPIESGSLWSQRAAGADVRIVYGPRDAVRLARENPERTVIFFSVGFETTAAPVAGLLLGELPDNLLLYCCHRYVPPAVRTLAQDDDGFISGYLLPGHAAVITGTRAYEFLPEQCNAASAVTGFEPVDVLSGLLSILRQLRTGEPHVANCYPRAVRAAGNERAQAVLAEVFDIEDASWRGIGVLPGTGFKLKERFAAHDALMRLGLSEVPADDILPGCQCHKVVVGRLQPDQCGLFGSRCTPEHPQGPCMVGNEGTCRAAYLFPENDDD